MKPDLDLTNATHGPSSSSSIDLGEDIWGSGIWLDSPSSTPGSTWTTDDIFKFNLGLITIITILLKI